MRDFFVAAAITFFGMFFVMPLVLGLIRMFGFYAIVEERRCRVYVLFGKIVAVLREPGLHFLWFKLGSVYIRKVHFRDGGMIRQIEEKVVNRLRQVTSAIKQEGANQVNVITSTAERQAAIEFARAAATRPQIVGAALREIAADPEIAEALFQVLETEQMVAGEADITLVPQGRALLADLMAARDSARRPPAAASAPA